MAKGYDIRRARRDRERERDLCGETLAEARRRQTGDGREIGDHLTKRHCRETFDLFQPRTLDLFTDRRDH